VKLFSIIRRAHRKQAKGGEVCRCLIRGEKFIQEYFQEDLFFIRKGSQEGRKIAAEELTEVFKGSKC